MLFFRVNENQVSSYIDFAFFLALGVDEKKVLSLDHHMIIQCKSACTLKILGDFPTSALTFYVLFVMRTFNSVVDPKLIFSDPDSNPACFKKDIRLYLICPQGS
jgi:hypothetical protein